MTASFDCADPDQRSLGIASAVGALKGGRLVVMPTDTVYGIGADAFDNTAVATLLSASPVAGCAPAVVSPSNTMTRRRRKLSN